MGAAKQRALLAILLVHANEVVPSDRLIEELWPEPPETAANALQVYVGKLRKALEPDRAPGSPGELLVTRAPGYVLRVEPDELDADRFERLLSEGRSARQANDPEAAATPRFARRSTCGGARRSPTSPTTRSLRPRSRAWRSCAWTPSRSASRRSSPLGRAGELVGELEALIRENPLRERLRGQLMLALYRSGRQADALEVYRQTRETLDEELGLAPSRALQRLQTAHPPPGADPRRLDRRAGPGRGVLGRRPRRRPPRLQPRSERR